MSIETILSIIELTTKVLAGIGDLVAKGKVVMSETDAGRIRAALAEAQTTTAALRPAVDAALTAAAKR